MSYLELKWRMISCQPVPGDRGWGWQVCLCQSGELSSLPPSPVSQPKKQTPEFWVCAVLGTNLLWFPHNSIHRIPGLGQLTSSETCTVSMAVPMLCAHSRQSQPSILGPGNTKMSKGHLWLPLPVMRTGTQRSNQNHLIAAAQLVCSTWFQEVNANSVSATIFLPALSRTDLHL